MSIFDIADSISKDPDFDLQDQLQNHEIVDILHSIGSIEFKEEDFATKSNRILERSLTSMKNAIFEYVTNTCGCVM